MPGYETGLRSKQATPTQPEECGPFIRDTVPAKRWIGNPKASDFTSDKDFSLSTLEILGDKEGGS